jgi:hypothetical protein
VYCTSNSNVLRFVAKEILDSGPMSNSSKRFNFVCMFLQRLHGPEKIDRLLR